MTPVSFRKAMMIAKDWAFYNRHTRRAASMALETRDLIKRPTTADEVTESLTRLTLAARGTRHSGQLGRLEEKIRGRVAGWDARAIDWSRFYPLSEPRMVQKALILKAPGAGGEKGVLFIAFEDNWLRVMRHANLAALSADYDIVLSPTWSPPHDLAMLIAMRLWPGKLYTILSNFDDEAVFPRLHGNTRTIRLLASSWVNPATFLPPPSRDPKFDIFVLANFASYKRHFALFRVMSRMDSRYRAVLAGRGWEGRTAAHLASEAAMFGVRERVEIREGLDDSEMIATMHSAKVSVIMSLGEGACVAVAESLFGDVPVGLIRGANIGSRAFINERTGRLLSPGRLPQELSEFIDAAHTFRPREWMLKSGIGYVESSRHLSAAMQNFAIQDGVPWTADLAEMQWRPNAEYGSTSDGLALLREYESFEQKYGVSVQLPPSLR